MNNLPEFFLACDTETSGIIIPGTEKQGQKPSQCLSIAACIVNTRTLEEKASFNSTIQFDESRFDWSNKAQEIHGLSQESLASSPTMVAVAQNLKEFGVVTGASILFLGHNPNFDKAFLTQVMAEIGEEVEFHYRAIDTFTLGYAAFGLQNSDEQFEFLGVDRSAGHNALEDIRLSLSMLRFVREAGNQWRANPQNKLNLTTFALKHGINKNQEIKPGTLLSALLEK